MRQLPESIWYAVEALHFYNLDPVHREIYLVGEDDRGSEDLEEPGVEFAMANRFVKNLRFLELDSPKKPILVHMKTNGGYWSEGMAIYDAIKSCKAPVTIVNYTHARSMSSIILQAADTRVMMPNATFMFHQGSYAMSGTYKQVITDLEFSRRVEDPTMMKIYVDSMKHRGKYEDWSEKKLENWLTRQMNLKEEVYLTANEAIDLGFADDIFDGDWSKYKY